MDLKMPSLGGLPSAPSLPSGPFSEAQLEEMKREAKEFLEKFEKVCFFPFLYLLT